MSKPAPHDRVRQTRLAQHLTQGQLAERVGCTQSAISHFENGEEHVLSADMISLVEKALGLSADSIAPALPPMETSGKEAIAFCPNYDCPGALPTVIRGKISVPPTFYAVWEGVSATYCKMCGTILERGCASCCTPLMDGASFCVGCGAALVTGASELQPADPQEYAEHAHKRRTSYIAAKLPVENVPRPHLPNTGQGFTPST